MNELAKSERLPDAYFDGENLELQLVKDLPGALRELAAAMESGAIEGRMSALQPVAGLDDRVHLLLTLRLAVPVRRALG